MGRLLGLHLLPGVAVMAVYVALAPVLARHGVPTNAALLIAFLVGGWPVMLGVMKRARRRGDVPLVPWRARLPWWEYAAWLVALTAFAFGVLFTLAPLLGKLSAALVGSFLGARVISQAPAEITDPLVIVLLIVVAAYTMAKGRFGTEQNEAPRESRLHAALIGGAMGFYDGFFGPGTGSFLIFLFVRVLRYNFLRASAMAKLVNLTTNFSAIIYFFLTNHILYQIGLPMAACNITGGIIGSRLAIARGSPFVRAVFLTVVASLIVGLIIEKIVGY